jgi:uncharacterized membrane protein YphA (DoxX/SURF4 family)
MLASLLFMITATVLCMLGLMEIYFPEWFSWHELLMQSYPNLYMYQYHIGLGQILVGGLLIWPAIRFHKHFALGYLELAFRIGLAVMFIGAALFKIHNPKEFALLVTQYLFLPSFTVNLFALLMPAAEFIFGILLLIGPKTKENAFMISAMMVSFIIALASAVYRDLGIVCGCFVGLQGAQDKSEAVVSMIRDIILMAPLVFLCTRPNRYLWQVWKK